MSKKTRYELVCEELSEKSEIWLVTGVAGFIGSNLLEKLLKLNQFVVGIDNFSTGFQRNLDEVKSLVSDEQWQRFFFIDGDIADLESCKAALIHPSAGAVNYVLHQAALGSVPRSIDNPINTNNSNITGFLNMLVASREANVKTFVYAASSSTYGDHPALPKVEDIIGNPLSPYAVTKYVNELYANVFNRVYGLKTIGIRYFNVFGQRQHPDGAYAAVIPKWTAAIIRGNDVFINGDGETSRDFSYIANAVQMNILSATADEAAKGHVYNMAVGDRTTLNELFTAILDCANDHGINYDKKAIYREYRAGDVRHSQANIYKAIQYLGYAPTHKIKQGIAESMPWYVKNIT